MDCINEPFRVVFTFVTNKDNETLQTFERYRGVKSDASGVTLI